MIRLDTPLPVSTDVGSLGVFQLKRIWARAMLTRQGTPAAEPVEHGLDLLVINAVGLGLEQALGFLFRKVPAFDEFERWITATAGSLAPAQVARINAAVTGAPYPPEVQKQIDAVAAAAPVLSAEDVAFWEREGFLVLTNAVPPEACAAAAQATWHHTGAKSDDPNTWDVQPVPGVTVPLFQHPALSAIRASARIHKAFAQLWDSADLWMTTDRVHFLPPERPGQHPTGSRLNWDVSLQPPIPFRTQGMLYLTDTPVEQGAFTCVPGFHQRIEEWLAKLPKGADPRQQDLRPFGPRAVPGKAGDLIIWHQALPHGANPNRGKLPRLVHYINMHPTKVEEAAVWV